ncbi:hypothetical protein NBRC116598_40790 [Pseudophaeobacter arcticus]|uniref:Transposase n=1 Tax=Pseudophaeobacter arcticus TaxID=385492 RepID=A0ABQ0ASA4_9RHOB
MGQNDPKDAQVILHLMEIKNTQLYYDPLACGTNDIQELSKPHDIVSKSKTELWHRILTHYLPLYFPEADRFHRSSRGDWFFAFLERYRGLAKPLPVTGNSSRPRGRAKP